MANVVDFIMNITAGKSPVNIRKIADQLKGVQKRLGETKDKAKDSFKKFAQSAKKTQKDVKNLSKELGKISAVAGGSVVAFVALNKVIADSTNQIIDASTRSGIAAETLAGLRLAAEGSGKSFSSLERGLDQFSTKMLDTARGTGDAKKTFDSLGISVLDAEGNLKDTNSVFNETIKKLGQMTNETKRNADINKLFGRSGMTLIQSGAIDNLDEFIGKAKELGPAFDENGIEKAAEFQRGMAEFKLASIGALQSILEGLTGEKGIGNALKTLAEDMSNFAGGFKIFMGGMRNTFAGMKIFAEDLKQTIEDIKNMDLNTFVTGALAGFGGAAFQQRMNEAEKARLSFVEQQKRAAEDGLTFEESIEKQIAQNEKRKTENMIKGEKTRAEIRKREIASLAKRIESGEIVDFQNVSNQLLSLRGRIRKAGESVVEIDKLIASFKKLRKVQVTTKKGTAFDKIDFGQTGEGGSVKEDPFVKQFNDSLKAGAQLLDKYRKKARDLNFKTLTKLNDQFLSLAEKVRSGNFDFVEAGNEAEVLKLKFQDIGQDTTGIDQLINKINELQSATKNIDKLNVSLSLSTDIVNLASGDILGALQSVLSKFLSEAQMKTANLAIGGVSALASFGGELAQAGQTAVDDEERKREDRIIANMERSFNRSLSDAEKERVRNTINLSEKEQEKLREQAMKERAAERVENFILAIKTGIQMLPAVLFEVLPPLFVQLAQDITQALIELPFRIVKGIVEGIKNLFSMVVEGPKKIFENLGTFFGNLFDGKRTGGRILSARRGLRFTGSQEQSLAMLHRNEFVVPQSGARPQAVERIMREQSSGGMTININADVVDRDAVETLVRKIEQRFQSFGQFQSSLFAG